MGDNEVLRCRSEEAFSELHRSRNHWFASQTVGLEILARGMFHAVSNDKIPLDVEGFLVPGNLI